MTPRARVEKMTERYIRNQINGENYLYERDVIKLLLCEHQRVVRLVRNQTRYVQDGRGAMTTEHVGRWIDVYDLLAALRGTR